MVQYLPFILEVNVNDTEAIKGMLPNRDSLNTWQQHRYDVMLEQFSARQPYLWTNGHHGCIWNNYFREKELLMDNDVDGVYCCGLGFENFFIAYQRWMAAWFETDIDLSYPQMKELLERFFVYQKRNDETYRKGCGYAIARLGELLRLRWNTAKSTGSITDLGDFDTDFGATFSYHTDPYQAQFGDDVQLQYKSDIYSKGGGHMGVFVGIESRVNKDTGNTEDAMRIFQANYGGDYGMPGGVNFGFFWIDREKEGFKRTFHIGHIQPTS